MRLARTAAFIFFAIAVPCTASPVRAESIVWNTTQPSTVLCSQKSDGSRYCSGFLQNPNFTIQYHASASLVDQNGIRIAPLTCGSTVHVGDRVTFNFAPHFPEDAYWFSTGGAMDSPYGDWIANSVNPTPIGCYPKDYVGTYTTRNVQGTVVTAFIYAPFSVNPPQRFLSVPASTFGICQTSADGVSQTCTAQAPGTASAEFKFGPTYGKFYFRSGNKKFVSKAQLDSDPTQCNRGDPAFAYPMVTLDASAQLLLFQSRTAADFTNKIGARTFPDYQLAIPEQVISCPITVGEPDPNNAPPTLTASSGAACVVGQSHTLNMSATDPDDDNLRYGIDWDADGSVDEFAPASGFVSSNTSQTASRFYSIAGDKTVNVMAQGESGLSSEWTSVLFQCAEPPPAAVPLCADGRDNDGDGAIDMADIGCLTEADNNESNPPPSSNPAADLSIRAIPSLVKSGRTTKINWNAENVQSCTVTAPNGDAWNTIASAVGGELSRSITGETVYTLSCIDLDGATQTKSAKIRILPSFKEL